MPRAKVPKDIKRFKEVVRFLLGDGTLDGHWFGDPPPTKVAGRPAAYWWRKHLRSASERMLFEWWKAKEQAAPFTGVRPGDFVAPTRKK